MSSIQTIEISATSTESFEDAIRTGLSRASRRYKNIGGAWVKEQQMDIANGQVTAFRVNLHVTLSH